MAQSITLEEAASEMSVSPETIRKLLGRGELRGHRVGRAIRVYQESVEDYQRRHEIVPKSEAKPRRARKMMSAHQRAEEQLRKLGC